MRLVSYPTTTYARPTARAAEPVGAGAMSDSLHTVIDTGARLLHWQGGQAPAPSAPARSILDQVAQDAMGFIKKLGSAFTQTNWDTGLPPVAATPAPAPAKPAPKPAEPKPPKAQPKPSKPAPKPAKPAPKPAKPAPTATNKLKTMSVAELKHLGATNHKAFLEALRPAAEEAEKKYGVPAAVTMAQAALETGWGQHIIPGYNVFGMKGTGPAGSTQQKTWEVYNGRTVHITAAFKKFHNFYEGVIEHGKLFHNGYYNKALANFKKYHSAERFAHDITGTYATDPSYGNKLVSIMRTYKL